MTHATDKTTPRFVARKDLWVILLLLAFGVGAWFFVNRSEQPANPSSYARIEYDGEVLTTLSLEEDQKYVVPQNTEVVIEVRDGMVGFVHSDCPDQVCVHTGFFQAGGFAACLPNRVLVQVEADAGSQADRVAG